jgi:hypothetical protein
MATTTPNYGWPVPTSTDYVKDGATAIEALGDAIDATVFGLGSSGLTLINTTTVSAQSFVTISNIFSSTYQNYKMIIQLTAASATSSLTAQMTTGGTAATTSYYYGGWSVNENNGTAGVTGVNVSSFSLGGTNTSYPTGSVASYEIYDPFNTIWTKFTGTAFYINSTPAGVYLGTSGGHFQNTSYDGLKIAAGSGTFTGTVRIYGYKNS